MAKHFLQLIVSVALFSAASSAGSDWGYCATDSGTSVEVDGTSVVCESTWFKKYPDCNQTQQSPIDFSGSYVSGVMEPLNYQIEGSGCSTALLEDAVSNGHGWKVDFHGSCTENYITWADGVKYYPIQFHMHLLSEHTVDGDYHDMELHIVHASDAGNILVTGIFLDHGNSFPDNVALAPFFDNIYNGQTLDNPVNPYDLLPEDLSYYHYDGSFTTPPCTEGVRWIVLKNAVGISQNQYDTFKEQAMAVLSQTKVAVSNHRPIQPVNDRIVFTYDESECSSATTITTDNDSDNGEIAVWAAIVVTVSVVSVFWAAGLIALSYRNSLKGGRELPAKEEEAPVAVASCITPKVIESQEPTRKTYDEEEPEGVADDGKDETDSQRSSGVVSVRIEEFEKRSAKNL